MIVDWEDEEMKPQELENRLIDFAVAIMEVTEALPNTKAGSLPERLRDAVARAGARQGLRAWIYREGAKVAEGRKGR